MCPSYQERTAYERSTAADALTARQAQLRVLCLSVQSRAAVLPPLTK